MWHVPKPGIEPVSPTLTDGFLTTVPPGKSWIKFLKESLNLYVPTLLTFIEHLWVFHGCSLYLGFQFYSLEKLDHMCTAVNHHQNHPLFLEMNTLLPIGSSDSSVGYSFPVCWSFHMGVLPTVDQYVTIIFCYSSVCVCAHVCVHPCVCRVYTDQYTSDVKCLLDEKLNWAGGGKWYRWRNNLLWEEIKGQVERFKTQISIGTASNTNEWSRQVVNNKERWGLQRTEGRML